MQNSYNSFHELCNKENYMNFMNHGYYPCSNILKNQNLIFKYEPTLYIELIKNINSENLKLLDIGCGRGGGLETYNKYFKFKELHGCDLNKLAITYCKNKNSKISYKVCNSEQLDYPDNYFDVVTNVESLHCYNEPQKFIAEALRVLNLNGDLIITDINLNLNLFNDFNILNIIDITPNVAFACKHNIINFNNSIKNEKIREFLISLSTEKFFNYLHKGTYYIIHLKK